MITSEICAPSTPARLSVSWIASFPSSWAGRVANAPLKAPTGVRAAATMTISSFICNSLGIRLEAADLLLSRVSAPSKPHTARQSAGHCRILGICAPACQLEGLPVCSASFWYTVAARSCRHVGHRQNGGCGGKKQAMLRGQAPTEFTHGCGTGHDQEIRQPTALQHRYKHLCDARRPRGHGQGGGGFHRPRRQDRRGHHSTSFGANHF